MNSKNNQIALLHRFVLSGRKPFIMAAAVLALASAAPAAQVGLKIGINANGGVQSGATGALQPGDLAGAPSYAQTNWNVLGRWGSGVNPVDTNGVASGLTINWDCTGIFSQAGGGTPTAQGTPDGNLMN